jgi:hypothetical protein
METQIGAAYLARTSGASSKAPWVILAVLGLAALALVAYIVMK